MKKLIFIPLFLCLISSCSIFTQKKCADIDWNGEGFKAGKNGDLNINFYKMSSNCKGTADQAAYDLGFKEGRKIFCSPKNAFTMGIEGKGYKNLCPDEDRDLFQKRFRIGHNIYMIEREIEDKDDRIRELQDELRYRTDINNDEVMMSKKAKLDELIKEQNNNKEILKKLTDDARKAGFLD